MNPWWSFQTPYPQAFYSRIAKTVADGGGAPREEPWSVRMREARKGIDPAITERELGPITFEKLVDMRRQLALSTWENVAAEKVKGVEQAVTREIARLAELNV